MKKDIKNTLMLSLFVGLAFCLPLFGGCQKDTLEEDTNMISLSEVAEDPSYANLPLIGTEWKLVGFVDGRTGKIQWVESPPWECGQCFTVVFKEDYKIEGFSSGNASMGHYSIDKEQEHYFSTFSFGPMTYAGETPDGYRFVDLMKKTVKFDIGSRGLSLYHDPTNYLLLQPLKE